jgi:spermidine synthase
VLHLDDDFAVLGSFVAGPSALARLAAGAPLNTDDLSVVAYRAPLATYAPEATPRARLLQLLDLIDVHPEDVVIAAPAYRERLVAYWAARDRFLRFGTGVRPSAEAREMLAQVRTPLLQILQVSPDFRPAYDPLLRMALALGPRDAEQARSLLAELDAARQARPEAGHLLQALGAARAQP